MGANFAARRRLFTSIGGFDEVLGGGGPLRSSQDYDLAYRTYKSGSSILLRPEVTLRHDGRREIEDWPTLLLNYGTGDGGFYTKHVRCLDPYAAWLFAEGVDEVRRSVRDQAVGQEGQGERAVLQRSARRRPGKLQVQGRPRSASLCSADNCALMSTRIVIVGAGPTGLGAGYRLAELGHDDWDIFERTDHVGGLAVERASIRTASSGTTADT